MDKKEMTPKQYGEMLGLMANAFNKLSIDISKGFGNTYNKTKLNITNTNFEILPVCRKKDKGEYITIPKKSKLFGKRYLKVVEVEE